TVRLQREKLEMTRSLQRTNLQFQHYQQLLDHAPDAIVVVGDDSRIRLVNLQTETMFGYAREELLGQPLEVLLPERFRHGHGAHMSRFFANPRARPMGSRLELYGRRK